MKRLSLATLVLALLSAACSCPTAPRSDVERRCERRFQDGAAQHLTRSQIADWHPECRGFV